MCNFEDIKPNEDNDLKIRSGIKDTTTTDGPVTESTDDSAPLQYFTE